MQSPVIFRRLMHWLGFRQGAVMEPTIGSSGVTFDVCAGPVIDMGAESCPAIELDASACPAIAADAEGGP